MRSSGASMGVYPHVIHPRACSVGFTTRRCAIFFFPTPLPVLPLPPPPFAFLPRPGMKTSLFKLLRYLG